MRITVNNIDENVENITLIIIPIINVVMNINFECFDMDFVLSNIANRLLKNCFMNYILYNI